MNSIEDKHKQLVAGLSQLPASCCESALELQTMREIYEDKGVFSKRMIDGIIKILLDHNDQNLRQELHDYPKFMERIVKENINCG